MQFKNDYHVFYFLPLPQTHLDVLWYNAKSNVDKESKDIGPL